MDYTNGSGIYKHDSVDEPKATKRVLVPQIEEIRMMYGADGEEYINVKDMTKAMEVVAMGMPTPTLSVISFIRRFTIELITARR